MCTSCGKSTKIQNGNRGSAPKMPSTGRRVGMGQGTPYGSPKVKVSFAKRGR